ncbi:NUDIX hydrolase [Paenibacillus sedimenti]|uniref:NUDIX domain-containing protein n=1 Tax=Paenibacillus sedimenti TaxID=2770274 RepID=A0A926KZD4_9BACL|nr:NUDIX domain-containing protein [Paenibacillus sedimenti]MBD0384914.1 NUDIX domain-containing protein [Paenibacillus sedimenti]
MKEKLIFGEKFNHLKYQRRDGYYAVIIDTNKQQVASVLTAKRSYFLPGGGIEEDETPEECLRRELLEETGYEINIGSYIGKAQRYFISPQNEPLLSNGIFFIAEFIEKVQEPMDDDHHLRWINLDQVDNLFFHEHHSWAVKKASQRFN